MWTDDMMQTVQRLLATKKDVPGVLLVLLHDIQDALGYVPDEAVPLVAKALNLSRAEVHGVLTYYHYFRRNPAGRHVVQLCRAEACQACGADELLERAEAMFGCKLHDTRADGAVTLEPVYCLGLCAASPAISMDGRLHARVTPALMQRLADQLEITP